LQRAEAATTNTGAPSVPMKGIWRTIRGYILWSYERGTIQYDVMVTLILLFVFLSPYWINFNDKPVDRNPHPTGVMVLPDAGGGFIYEIQASAISGRDPAAIHDQLLHIIEPIAGEVSITKVEAVPDKSGRVQTYRVWIER
jgi:hypothetical protein